MQTDGYLAIYNSNQPDLSDDTNDPDFRCRPFTWGICRPQVRRYVKCGQYLFFAARRKETGEFFLKGYFRIEDKLTLLNVLEKKRFSKRQNVIAERLPASTQPLEALATYIEHREVVWKTRLLKKRPGLQPLNLDNPSKRDLPLCVFREDGQLFVHSYWDHHHPDEWHCSRLFLCPKKGREQCVKSLEGCENKRRERGASLASRPYYVVGDQKDCGYLRERILWDQLGDQYRDLLRKALVLPANLSHEEHERQKVYCQVNVVRLNGEQVKELRSHFRQSS